MQRVINETQMNHFISNRYEYTPHLRQSPGLSNIPGGDDFYKAALKLYLGADMTPEQVSNVVMNPMDKKCFHSNL